MIPLIPVVLAGGLTLAFVRARKGKMTPEKKKQFENALKNVNDTAKLEKLADTFQKDGLRAEANELRKRIKVINMPATKKEQYKTAYKKGMSSTDPAKIKTLAEALHNKGFYGSAKNLRDYAHGLVENMKAHLPATHSSEDVIETGADHGLEGNYGGDTGVVETEGVEIVEGS